MCILLREEKSDSDKIQVFIQVLKIQVFKIQAFHSLYIIWRIQNTKNKKEMKWTSDPTPSEGMLTV